MLWIPFCRKNLSQFSTWVSCAPLIHILEVAEKTFSLMRLDCRFLRAFEFNHFSAIDKKIKEEVEKKNGAKQTRKKTKTENLFAYMLEIYLLCAHLRLNRMEIIRWIRNWIFFLLKLNARHKEVNLSLWLKACFILNTSSELNSTPSKINCTHNCAIWALQLWTSYINLFIFAIGNCAVIKEENSISVQFRRDWKFH